MRQSSQCQRVVYRVDAVTSKREIIGEFPYTTANLSLCTGMGVKYPHTEARLRHMHSSKILHFISKSFVEIERLTKVSVLLSKVSLLQCR